MSLNNLIEPPLENCTSKALGKVFESPVQPVRAHSRIVASPTYLRSNGRSSNLIDAPAPHILTLSSPKRKRPRLSTHPMASVKHRKHGTSPLSQPSPNGHVTDHEKSDYNRTDEINWDVRDEQVTDWKHFFSPNTGSHFKKHHAVLYAFRLVYTLYKTGMSALVTWLLNPLYTVLLTSLFRSSNTGMCLQWYKRLVVKHYRVTVGKSFAFITV
jgi:hypothetical protein